MKVVKVETYNNLLVAKGKLVLTNPSDGELSSIPPEGIKDKYVWIKTSEIDEYPCLDMFKPVILSEEFIDGRNFIYYSYHKVLTPYGIGSYMGYSELIPNSGVKTHEVQLEYSYKGNEKFYTNGHNEIQLILVLPEEFTNSQLKQVIAGELKDDVYVECELHQEIYDDILDGIWNYHRVKKIDKKINIIPINK